MTRPRNEQVSLDATPYYHVICRCVRRAFLCGQDALSGQDYAHRRQWVVERLALLVEVFSIDLCAYAVMSNHYHLVIHIDGARVEQWSDREVAERWLRLFTGPLFVQGWLRGDVDVATQNKALEVIAVWRSRLCDLGWFMKCLNEHLARRANEEDGCTGRFWESRYKSQALLDESALLACMAYVDLNPVRADMAKTPELSDYTSIQQRCQSVTASSGPAEQKPQLVLLQGLPEQSSILCPGLSEVRLFDYLELVDWTGRAVRANKRGFIPQDAPPLLSRLRIEPKVWLSHMQPRPNRLLVAIGAKARLKQFLRCTGRHWIQHAGQACRLSAV